VGKPEGKNPLRRHGHGWEDNIGSYLIYIGWDVVEWINTV
jgi:hypothetical protein